MSNLIQARLNIEEKDLILNYAKINNLSVSDLIRNSVIEKIEDEIDIDLYKKAIAEYEKNPVTYTQEEVEKELGFI